MRLLLVVSGLAPLLLAFSGTAGTQTTQLLPGVTYTSDVEFTLHGPVALQVVHGPRPVGLYRLRAVLSNDAVTGRETVSSMERRLSSQATAIGVNGDYFRWADGHPSGILMRDGVLVTAPSPNRSSAGVTADGTVDVERVKLIGTWRGTGQRWMLNQFNKSPGPNEIALFTSDWGRTSPKVAGAVVAVLTGFPEATPNADLTATVASVGPAGAVRLAPGTAALVARGNAAQKLQADAPVGTVVTLRLILQPDWSGVADAIGGGPVLVRDGKPVYRAGESFTTLQLQPRAPRTAVGQLADGSILLVTTDGRQPGYSVGMTNFELAQALVRLGAVRAMALDTGGSTTLAFDGIVLNRPSDGRERPVATALMLLYTGVYVPPVIPVVSPNGDGVAERQALDFKIVRPSTVTTSLFAPDGTAALQETAEREPGVYQVPFPPPSPTPPEGTPSPSPVPSSPAEGRWRVTITATDDQGLTSSATRRFAVNSTLGFLRLQPRPLPLPPGGATETIRWAQSRAAQITVTVETADGVVVRTLRQRTYDPGEITVAWNGRRQGGGLAFTGRYRIQVAARNDLGTVTLTQPLSVRRTPAPKR